MKKKTKGKKNEPRIERVSAARSSGKSNKKQIDDGTEEFMGVHIISERDTERHFGSSEIKTSDAANQKPETDLPNADVHLQLDGRIWQEAKAEAARLGMEIREYLELALENFKSRPAK